MAFWIASSPHNHTQNKTSALMRLVIYATIPGILAQWYFFGWGNLIHILLGITTALVAEFFVLSLREKKFINGFFFLFFLSFFLELLHFFIPNRAFELNDLLANIIGVLSILFLFILKKNFTR